MECFDTIIIREFFSFSESLILRNLKRFYFTMAHMCISEKRLIVSVKKIFSEELEMITKFAEIN